MSEASDPDSMICGWELFRAWRDEAYETVQRGDCCGDVDDLAEDGFCFRAAVICPAWKKAKEVTGE